MQRRLWRTKALAMRIAILAMAIVLALSAAGCRVEPSDSSTAEPVSQPSDLPSGAVAAEVDRVVDGDTIDVIIDGRVERVRYIGIDAPETVRPNSPVECYGPEASEANKRLVDGETVYLVRDVSERDDFDRLLRYVYIQTDAAGAVTFVNLELVAGGFAQANDYPPDVARQDELDQAQDEAHDAEIGMWGECF